jgi:hypothetical protein
MSDWITELIQTLLSPALGAIAVSWCQAIAKRYHHRPKVSYSEKSGGNCLCAADATLG